MILKVLLLKTLKMLFLKHELVQRSRFFMNVRKIEGNIIVLMIDTVFLFI